MEQRTTSARICARDSAASTARGARSAGRRGDGRRGDGRRGDGRRRYLADDVSRAAGMGNAGPSARLVLLEQPDVIRALGSRECERLRRELNRVLNLAQRACTGAWFRAIWHRGEAFPPPGMVLSRIKTQFGVEGTESHQAVAMRRWTPAIAVAEEDMIDAMGEREALEYPHPPSPSAAVIREAGYRFGERI